VWPRKPLLNLPVCDEITRPRGRWLRGCAPPVQLAEMFMVKVLTTHAARYPDLSRRPFELTVEREFRSPAAALFRAWTQGLDGWLAAPGSVAMRPEVNAPFFFETEQWAEAATEIQRHPHYGRFLQIIPDRLVQLTWMTGANGTEGAETIVTVELHLRGEGSVLRLHHAGFPTASARDRHRESWPLVLQQLAHRLGEPP